MDEVGSFICQLRRELGRSRVRVQKRHKKGGARERTQQEEKRLPSVEQRAGNIPGGGMASAYLRNVNATVLSL